MGSCEYTVAPHAAICLWAISRVQRFHYQKRDHEFTLLLLIFEVILKRAFPNCLTGKVGKHWAKLSCGGIPGESMP